MSKFDNFNWGSPDSFGDIPKPGFTREGHQLDPDDETRVQALEAWTFRLYYCEEILKEAESLELKWCCYAAREIEAAKGTIETLKQSLEGDKYERR